MQPKKTLSITEARKKIFQIAEDVQNSRVHYTLTEHGKPKAIIISAQEFYSLVETVGVTKDFPNLKKNILKRKKEFENNYFSTLEEALEKEGYIVADKAKKIYGTNNTNKQNSRKSKKTK